MKRIRSTRQRDVSARSGLEVNCGLMNAADARDYATDAIKFWEPRRVAYNLVLTAVVVIYFVVSYPLSRAIVSVDFCLGLFLLAVIANVAYCAAYIVDIFAQAS